MSRNYSKYTSIHLYKLQMLKNLPIFSLTDFLLTLALLKIVEKSISNFISLS